MYYLIINYNQNIKILRLIKYIINTCEFNIIIN